jgi:tryptophan synthase beta subunit
MDKTDSIVVTLSGRGDKDMGIIMDYTKTNAQKMKKHHTKTNKK